MSKETLYSPEFVAAVSELVELTLPTTFSEITAAYLAKNADQPYLTKNHLIDEILEAGAYQAENPASFDEAVMVGAQALLSEFL